VPSSTLAPSTVPPTPVTQRPFPCLREGYFSITTPADKALYCPPANSRCDFVLCSKYDSYGVWIRAFYNCPQNSGSLNNYYFDEGRQTCIRR